MWSYTSPEPYLKVSVRNELDQSHWFEQTKIIDDERFKFVIISVVGSWEQGSEDPGLDADTQPAWERFLTFHCQQRNIYKDF